MPDDVVKLEVGGTEFAGWEAITITRSLDSCADAFSLSAPFDPSQAQIAAAFRPFSYQPAVVTIDGELILTGRVEAVAPSISASDRAINVQGRSLTGALVDCSIDGAGFQFQGLSLKAIADKLAGPFGVAVVSTVGSGPAFKTAKGSTSLAEAEKALKDARAEPGTGVFDYLNKIARDAGLLLSCDVQGRLVITKIQPGAVPVASLVEGMGQVLTVEASFDGTKRFSRYKVLQQQDGATSIVGVADDSAVGVYRPKVDTGAEGEASDINKAAAWRRALGLAGAVTVGVKLSGWRTPAGSVWTPGMVVTLKAPGAFVMRDAAFVVAEATLSLDASQGRTSSLRLVLPETYSGGMPATEPWAGTPTPDRTVKLKGTRAL
jgi:prophage tail gpP-like protein